MFEMFFGHLTGDYLFQPKKMAEQKGKNTLVCFIHCLIYSLSIAIWTLKFNPLYLILVFCSHYFIDRYSLAYYWLKLIKGRDVLDKSDNFAPLVYATVDNTIHLILLYFITKI